MSAPSFFCRLRTWAGSSAGFIRPLVYIQAPTVWVFLAFVSAKAFLIRSGVMGSSNNLAPVASKMAFAITPPMQTMGGSPPPAGGISEFSISTVSIFGSHEKRGIS